MTGNGLAPDSGPGDESQYFPIAQGNVWSFNYTTYDSDAIAASAIVGLKVNGTKALQGVTGTILRRTDPTLQSGGYDQYFYVNHGGVSLLGTSDSSDTITPQIAPYAELLFPVQVGPVSTVTAVNLPFGRDSSGNTVTVDLTQTISNAAIESVDVPAGSFTNALRQTTSVNAPAHDRGQSSPSVSDNQIIWMVPGIGEVKEQVSISGGATTTTSYSELRGYTINGVMHGLGTATDLVANVDGANCIANGFSRPSVASDGTNHLVVTHRCESSSGTAMVKWVATLVGADGSIARSVDLSAAVTANSAHGLNVVVAYDGVNYLVVYEDDSVGSGKLDALLLSSSGSIVTGPNIVGAAAASTISAGASEALGFDGSRYLLVYVDANAAVPPRQMSGLFISPATGQADGVPFPISNSGPYHDEPAIGFDGTNYLVAWVENFSSPTGLYAARVSKTGVVLDPTAFLVMDDSGPASSGAGPCCYLSPTVSFDGTNYLIAYRDLRSAAPTGTP